jgi:hypothetical protein
VKTQRLGAGRLGLVPVMLCVQLGRLARMVRGVVGVPVSGVGVVRSGFMVTGFMVLGSFPMMTGRVLMMLGSLVVMLCGLLGHLVLLRFGLGGTA